MNLKQLTALFLKLGARNPEGWAKSQIEQGIPQLERFLFLRQAWRRIVREDDTTWIDAEIQGSQSKPSEPYAGVGHALKRLLAAGASREDITDLVRGTQTGLLFALCYLLEDPGDVESEVRDIAWALVCLDDDGFPTERVINGLHESVLEMDPTGREMRPRGS